MGDAYAWILEAFPSLLPLPPPDASTVMSGVITHDSRLGHLLLFRRQPPHLGWSAEEDETQ